MQGRGTLRDNVRLTDEALTAAATWRSPSRRLLRDGTRSE
jgi:hypothetical protein